MDFKEIKNFMPSNGEKVIIVENGKPVMVLLSFEDYQNIVQNSQNKEQNQKIKDEASLIEPTEELTLEDLPF